MRHSQADLIILTVMPCIDLFKAICELQKKVSSVVAIANACMIFTSEKLSAFVTLFLSSPKSVVGARHLSQGRKCMVVSLHEFCLTEFVIFF